MYAGTAIWGKWAYKWGDGGSVGYTGEGEAGWDERSSRLVSTPMRHEAAKVLQPVFAHGTSCRQVGDLATCPGQRRLES